MIASGSRKLRFSIRRRSAAAILLLLMVSAIITRVYLNEFALLLALYRYEGGLVALSSNPPRPHFVVSVRGPLPAAGLFVVADSGNSRSALPLQQNGCVALEGPGSQVNIGIHSAGSTSILAKVDAKYYCTVITPSPISSLNSSKVSFAPISAWKYVREVVKCTS
jgi:hypothetical protein